MTQLDPQKGNWTFEQDKDRLQVLKVNIKSATAAIKSTKQEMDAELEPYKAKLKEFEEEEKAVRERLTIQALGNFYASGNKTFGGVQLRETPSITVHNEAAVLAAMDGEGFHGKPVVVVTKTLDKRVLLEWVKARVSLGLDLPEGLEFSTNYSMALAADKDSEAT